MRLTSLISRLARRWACSSRSFLSNESGVAVIEMAYVTPVILLMGLGGIEVASLTLARMKVSQIALSIADNAARLGQTDNSGITPTITERDVDAVLDGAFRSGESIDLANKGRVVLSSVEYSEEADTQYIHWQRCRGDLDESSTYGNDTSDNGIQGGDLPPLGRGSAKFSVSSGQALMFVEVFYSYDGILGTYVLDSTTFVSEAGMLVRDDRNLTPGLTGGNSRSECDE